MIAMGSAVSTASTACVVSVLATVVSLKAVRSANADAKTIMKLVRDNNRVLEANATEKAAHNTAHKMLLEAVDAAIKDTMHNHHIAVKCMVSDAIKDTVSKQQGVGGCQPASGSGGVFSLSTRPFNTSYQAR